MHPWLWPYVILLAFALGLFAGQWWERRTQARARRVVSEREEGRISAVIQLRAAIHEAGHAVVILANPYTLHITEIEVDDGLRGGGRVRHRRLPGDTSDILWLDTVTYMAGIAAEAKAFRRFRSGPAASDLKQALANARVIVGRGDLTPPWRDPEELTPKSFDCSPMLSSITAGSPEAVVLNLAYAQAKRLVTRDWTRLNSVAEHLVQVGRLTRVDLDLFLRDL